MAKKYFLTLAFVPFIGAAAPLTVEWSGRTWEIKQSQLMGPGPNQWEASNVSVDNLGYLHLQVKPTQNNCSSGQIISKELFGEGQYEFEFDFPEKGWTKHLVLGLFQYPLKQTGPDKTHEIDIEFSFWSKDFYYGLINYTVWPTSLDIKRVTKNFKGTVAKNAYFKFIRHKNEQGVRSIAFYGKTPEVYAWSFEGNDIASPADMPVELNLWCYKGINEGLTGPVEVVVKSFKFTASK